MFKHLKILVFKAYKTSAKNFSIRKSFKYLDETLENNTCAK